MSDRRLSIKVGIFVLAGLVTLAVLLLNFSKSGGWARKTYPILLRTDNVGSITKRAAVLMAGIQVGYVESTRLSEDGKSVLMTARIFEEYDKIPRSCLFTIEQSGFLGDQYVAITPRNHAPPFLQPGDEVRCEPPFNLQDTARRASDLLSQVGVTIGELRVSISNVNDVVLSQTTLTNIVTNLLVSLNNIKAASEAVRDRVPVTLTNLHQVSASAVRTVADLEELVRAQTGAVSRTIGNLRESSSNILALSAGLARSGQGIEQMIETNRPKVDRVLNNVELASISVTNMVAGLKTDLESGQGLVGALLRDQEMKLKLDLALSNVVCLSSNLDVAAGNLNRHGLWWMLWKPKYPKTNVAEHVQPSQRRW